VRGRCLELAASQVADLSLADEVPVDGAGEGSVGRWCSSRGDGPGQRIRLSVVPNRCDGHAFLEAGFEALGDVG
jgi:hypothetical protein